jgi:hypothetical protein
VQVKRTAVSPMTPHCNSSFDAYTWSDTFCSTHWPRGTGFLQLPTAVTSTADQRLNRRVLDISWILFLCNFLIFFMDTRMFPC